MPGPDPFNQTPSAGASSRAGRTSPRSPGCLAGAQAGWPTSTTTWSLTPMALRFSRSPTRTSGVTTARSARVRTCRAPPEARARRRRALGPGADLQVRTLADRAVVTPEVLVGLRENLKAMGVKYHVVVEVGHPA